MKSKKVLRFLSISDCNWFIILENQSTDVSVNYGGLFLRQSVQQDRANRMQINKTQPTTNISNNNNLKSINRQCQALKHFGSGVVCIFTRHTGSSKYGTTRKNTQRYYTLKRLRKYIYPQLVLHQLQPNISFSYSF